MQHYDYKSVLCMFHYANVELYEECILGGLVLMNSSLLFKASSLPMSIIIVGVGPAEFDGKMREMCVSLRMCEDVISVQSIRDSEDQIKREICFTHVPVRPIRNFPKRHQKCVYYKSFDFSIGLSVHSLTHPAPLLSSGKCVIQLLLVKLFSLPIVDLYNFILFVL